MRCLQDGEKEIKVLPGLVFSMSNAKGVRRLPEGLTGRHLLIEIIGSALLNDKGLVEEFFRSLARLYGLEILALQVHQFEPYGLSGLLVMPESHVAIHTWPEYAYAALDIFVGSHFDPRESVALIEHCFQAEQVKLVELERGLPRRNGTLVRPELPERF
ncbi:MAG: adenosylmethionine decarboxylase [Candidatus Caldatribacteriaceae bacterium]